jgi:hypothetical protein
MEMLRVKGKYYMVQREEIINQDVAKMLIKLFSEFTKELRRLTFHERRMLLLLVVRGNCRYNCSHEVAEKLPNSPSENRAQALWLNEATL